MGLSDPPERRSAPVGGRVQAWREAGDTGAPALVLLHGIGGASDTWCAQYAAFAPSRRVIGWDMPGYGGSDPLADPAPGPDAYADALAALLDRLGVARADVLGQSVAAPVAARFCRRHPGRVDRVIFAHGLTGMGGLDPTARAAAKAARLEPFEALGPERFARERGPAILGPGAPEAVIARAVAIMAAVPAGAYRQAVEMLAASDLLADAPQVRAPALVLCGESDPVAPEAACRAVAAALPDADFRLLPAVGHYACMEDPGAFNAAVADFLGGA